MDFADVFDKAKTNILPSHSRHDLTIKIEDNEIALFGLVYDYFKLELDVLYEYIRDICTKSFIVFFKLFFGVSVLFTEKKNRRLKLYVNFQGLNAINKKNKHPLLLVQIFLNMLGWVKCYTKVDIITAYYALRIRAEEE